MCRSDTNILSLSKVNAIMQYSDDLTKARGIVARLLRAVCKAKQKKLKKSNQDVVDIMSELEPEDYKKADHAMRTVPMIYTGMVLIGINHRKLGPEFEEEVRGHHAEGPGYHQPRHPEP